MFGSQKTERTENQEANRRTKSKTRDQISPQYPEHNRRFRRQEKVKKE